MFENRCAMSTIRRIHSVCKHVKIVTSEYSVVDEPIKTPRTMLLVIRRILNIY